VNRVAKGHSPLSLSILNGHDSVSGGSSTQQQYTGEYRNNYYIVE